MTYQYGGKDTIAAAEQRRQQLQTELDQARQNYRAAQKLARENERIQAQILRTQQRTQQLTNPAPTKKLPPPRYGGRQGLVAATQEITQWHRKRKAA
jgi:chromatin segregation and condensation protein Rec8/ScpA/Scc1 (kleisin family)